MRFALRRWWRWLSALLTMLFVLVACGQGDSPLTVRPVADGSATDSVPLMRTGQSVVLTEAEAAFRVDYSVRSQWQEGFVADVTIQNLRDPIEGWTLDWIFPSDQIQITNLWNGQLIQDGDNVSVQDLGWNARIPSNGEITFGFEARYRGTDVIPSAFTLNGITLGNPTPAPLPAACEVNYQIRSQWEQGFVADLQLRNLGSPVTNWELSWAFPVEGVEITNLWNGQLAQNGREVKVTNLDWNATIANQQQLDLGFQAAYPGGGVTPTEFYLNGLLCNGLPASPGTPTPDGSGPTPDPTDELDELFPDLPPDPGEEGMRTLEGIDADGDGVRDDVQRFIFRRFPSDELKRKTMLQFAKAVQEELIVANRLDRQLSRQKTENTFRSTSCGRAIFGGEEFNRERKQAEIWILNTRERVEADIQSSYNISGEVFTSTGTHRSNCLF